jgi:hypothetical protein
VNEIEVGRLLTAAKVLDPKMPEPDEQGFVLKLWTRSLHDIPSAVAEEAMTDYYRSARYRENREPLSPADIVQFYRDRRRYTADPRDRPEFNADRIHSGVDKAIAALAGSKALAAGADAQEAADEAEGESALRRSIRAVACPYCHALAGMPCVASNGQPLVKTPAHPARMAAAFPCTDEGA